MSQSLIDDQECREDTARRLNTWLTVLEERIVALLRDNDPETLKPAEREQAVSRHLAMLLRLLQLRQKFAQPDPSPAEQALLDSIFRSDDLMNVDDQNR
ncbi:MAG TPA: hypothetical protein VJO32_15745 [Ktedonobacteraceae bacterium]|nr:hypothetical protein [Ktedonobacteraceae bacterium]